MFLQTTWGNNVPVCNVVALEIVNYSRRACVVTELTHDVKRGIEGVQAD